MTGIPFRKLRSQIVAEKRWHRVGQVISAAMQLFADEKKITTAALSEALGLSPRSVGSWAQEDLFLRKTVYKWQKIQKAGAAA